MIKREEFVERWKREFGCVCISQICWCDTAIKLGFLYDYLVENIGNHILSFVDTGRVKHETVGSENLPQFMDYRRRNDS